MEENTEKKSAFVTDDGLYGKKTVPVPAPERNIGVDTNDVLINGIADPDYGRSSHVDMTTIEKFTGVSRDRNQVYDMLDAMAEDSTIASVLETYATDVTEYNDSGKIVWAESTDEDVLKYVTFLLDAMNVDKNIYKWAFSLCKYGDLYLHLYRESDYADPIFGQKKEGREKLDESIKVIAHSKNDKYVHYVDMVANPATMFELTRFGKTYGYIKAPVVETQQKMANGITNDWYRYSFKQKDVEVYEPTEFVHACVEDNNSRTPEEVEIFVGEDDNSPKYTYTVRRGQSMLQTVFKIWREMMLLENSILLNRITKSAIVRIIGIEVGDMPKEQVGPHLDRVKSLIEQKAAIYANKSMSEYTNPGPIENNIYVPVRNGQGNISAQQIGGDVDVKGLADLDYFRQKFFGGLRVPAQFFGFTDDSTGFNGGTSLTIISSRYAKEVKRIQNTLIQAITDAINLMLWDKGLEKYIDRFEIHMLPPTTQEEINRRENLSSQVSITRDIIGLTDEIEHKPSRLKILKALISDVIANSEIISIIQDEIDRLEKEEKMGVDETAPAPEGEDMFGGEEPDSSGGSMDIGSLFGDTGEESSPSEPSSSAAEVASETSETPEETVGELPSPDSLGLDFTQNQNF